MSYFSGGQLNQLGDALEAAGWKAEDVTRLGQAGTIHLTEIRLSLVTSDIVRAIEAGETELWLHDEQKTGWVQGRKTLTHLTRNGLLDGCADLEELKLIQAQGIDFFRKHFRGKVIVGWRGVQGDGVPYLIGDGGKVVLCWDRLGDDWSASDHGLRRK